MHHRLGTTFRALFGDRRRHYSLSDKIEAERLQASDIDEISDQADAFKIKTPLCLKPENRCTTQAILIALRVLVTAVIIILAYIAGWQYLNYGLVSDTPVPRLPQEQIMISKDRLFSQPSTPEVDEAWDSLLPTDRGMIAIENPEHYGLPAGLESSDGKHTYGLTWTHQFHCLNMLRVEFWKLLRNESELPRIAQSEDENDKLRLYHNVHCFDYLRQTIMCNMDMTVEYAAKNKETGQSKGFINGWDIQHTCTSRKSVYDFMRKHAAEKKST